MAENQSKERNSALFAKSIAISMHFHIIYALPAVHCLRILFAFRRLSCRDYFIAMSIHDSNTDADSHIRIALSDFQFSPINMANVQCKY